MNGYPPDMDVAQVGPRFPCLSSDAYPILVTSRRNAPYCAPIRLDENLAGSAMRCSRSVEFDCVARATIALQRSSSFVSTRSPASPMIPRNRPEL